MHYERHEKTGHKIRKTQHKFSRYGPYLCHKVMDQLSPDPSYNEILKKAKEAKVLIDEARNNYDTRDEFYKQAKVHYGDLEKCVDGLDLARGELNKSMSRHNKKTVLAYAMLILALFAASYPIADAWGWITSQFTAESSPPPLPPSPPPSQ